MLGFYVVVASRMGSGDRGVGHSTIRVEEVRAKRCAGGRRIALACFVSSLPCFLRLRVRMMLVVTLYRWGFFFYRSGGEGETMLSPQREGPLRVSDVV